MSISIIGSGSIGTVLARRFAAKRLDVAITNSRGAASLAALAEELKPYVRAVDLPEALKAETIILALHNPSVPELSDKIDWSGRIVIDATNAVNMTDFSPADLGGRASSDIVAELLAGARVVKAFNTLFAKKLAEEVSGTGRRVIFLSGNDAQARKTVAALVEQLGYAPADLGAIGESTRLQQFGGTLVARNFIEE